MTTARALSSAATASSSRLQRREHALAQRVERLRPVERQRDDAARVDVAPDEGSELGGDAVVHGDPVLGLFDRRRRARPLAQLELLDLAGRGLRDRLEADLARHLVAGEQRAAVRDQLGRA